jgi:hypothetical protein
LGALASFIEQSLIDYHALERRDKIGPRNDALGVMSFQLEMRHPSSRLLHLLDLHVGEHRVPFDDVAYHVELSGDRPGF